MRVTPQVSRFFGSGLLLILILPCFPAISGAQAVPEVKLTVATANPRAVEPLTEHSIVRDYAAAWQELARASENNAVSLLDSYFAGNAKAMLTTAISGQIKTGTHTRYSNQVHNLKVTFYAPEGDVMELQDSAEYQMQIISEGKVIHDEHVVVQNLVLMTPAADRWVIRQLQAMPGS